MPELRAKVFPSFFRSLYKGYNLYLEEDGENIILNDCLHEFIIHILYILICEIIRSVIIQLIGSSEFWVFPSGF